MRADGEGLLMSRLVQHRSNFAAEIAFDIDHCFPEAIGVHGVSVAVKITDVQ